MSSASLRNPQRKGSRAKDSPQAQRATVRMDNVSVWHSPKMQCGTRGAPQEYNQYRYGGTQIRHRYRKKAKKEKRKTKQANKQTTSPTPNPPNRQPNKQPEKQRGTQTNKQIKQTNKLISKMTSEARTAIALIKSDTATSKEAQAQVPKFSRNEGK